MTGGTWARLNQCVAVSGEDSFRQVRSICPEQRIETEMKCIFTNPNKASQFVVDQCVGTFLTWKAL